MIGQLVVSNQAHSHAVRTIVIVITFIVVGREYHHLTRFGRTTTDSCHGFASGTMIDISVVGTQAHCHAVRTVISVTTFITVDSEYHHYYTATINHSNIFPFLIYF